MGGPGLGNNVLGKAILRDGREEDRTRDWLCKACGERNFQRRLQCHKCSGPRPAMYAGASQSWEDFLESGAGGARRSRSRSRKPKKSKKKKKSTSSSASSESSKGSSSSSENAEKGL